MSPWTRWIPALAVAVVLAACSGGESTNPMGPAGPRFNGGYVTGGNDTPPPDSTSNLTSAGSGTTTAESDSTSRGGGYVTGAN